MTQASARIIGVVVAFKPERDVFLQLVKATAAQTERLIIVDNAPDGAIPGWLAGDATANVAYVPQSANGGIAAAQNTGIARADELGADFVLLLDHDSIPAADMVAELLTAYQDLTGAGHRVAAVGPRIYDESRADTGTWSSFVKIIGAKLTRVAPAPGERHVEVSYLIASGSLIALTVLRDVGAMQADLFIEYVDIEWALRARSRGFASFGVWTARMRHSQGGEPIKILGRAYVRHSPYRNYYMFRNLTWLCRRDWMLPAWRAALIWNGMQRLALYLVFAGQALARMRFIARGLADGWRGRLGEMTQSD